MSERELLLELALQSDPVLLGSVRSAIQELTARMGFSITDCRAVTRAVDEALTNVIRHAYGSQPGQPITLSCFRAFGWSGGRAGEGLEIVLEDNGAPADPGKMHGRPLEEIKPGGLGLHYIRESMDFIEYTRSGNTNRLRLWKHLRQPESAAIS